MENPVKIEDFIRERAKMNWSRNMVAQALGMSFRKLKTMTDLMAGIDWPAPGKSEDCKRAYKTRTYKGGLENRQRSAYNMVAIRMARMPRYSVGGFTGTAAEQHAHWSPLVSVSLCQMRRRLKSGADIHDAMFKPSQVHTGWGHMPRMHLRRA